ncbi:MAG TPA: flavin-dependent monooxygenase [Deltaproteobacteria bacterium]|nr:flavin-dependent monooxygenase [Deltaproteobacteria bacterium]
MDDQTYLERVRDLIPGIRGRAATCEADRRLPEETFKEFQEAGLFRAMQPVRHGGYELKPLTFYQAIAEVAAACPSTGWVLGVIGIHNWQLGLFPDRAQRDVWGDDSGIQSSSSYAPTGRVERVDGGFRLSGRWSFSSGCDPCQWVLLGGRAPGEGPIPDQRTFLVPRSDYEIVDNWHVSGLCGTGSKDIEVENAFVPEHRTHRFIDAYNLDNPGQADNPGTLFRLPFGCVFAFAITAPAIGAAQGALDYYRGYIREKVSALAGARVADDPFAQRRIATAVAEIDAAKAEMSATWTQMWAIADAGEKIPIELRAKARWTGCNIVQRCVRAVDLLFEGSGGHGIYLDNPMQRYFRDVHAMRAHAFHNPDNAALSYGFTELHPDQAPHDFML